jgi:hypothetical protein
MVGDDDMHQRAGRHYVHAALIVAVLMTSGIVAGTDSEAKPMPPTRTARPAPHGQTVRNDVLPRHATTFRTQGTNGWELTSPGSVAWASNGHLSRGALRVRAHANLPRVASPKFRVTPLRRYMASAWLRSATKTRQSLALQFFDSTGKVIDEGSLVGQMQPVTSRWTQPLPVVGFAPPRAARARVMVFGLDKSSKKITSYVDDAVVSEVIGSPAPISGPLHTRGPEILDSKGRHVTLRGIEVQGMSQIGKTPVLRVLNDVNVAHMWGANFIRLGLNPDKLLINSPCTYDVNYVQEIDQVVNAITSRGMVAMLELQGFSLVPCKAPRLATMPDRRAITFWQKIATHYKDNPRVVFDIYNEPHDINGDVWLNGGRVEYGGVSYTAVGMRALYDTVRRTGAENLVWVSGTNWATNPSPAAPLKGAHNVVYAAHAYTCPNGLRSKGAYCPESQFGPNGIYDPRTMLTRFGRLGIRNPIHFDEFGWPQASNGRFDANLVRYIAKMPYAGWCAFTFDGSTSGLFNMVANIGPVENPSVRGMAIMQGLFAN